MGFKVWRKQFISDLQSKYKNSHLLKCSYVMYFQCHSNNMALNAIFNHSLFWYNFREG